MANTFLLTVTTPSHEVYNGEVEKVFLKNADGDFEVLANHENMIASTVPCIARFKDAKGAEEELFISTSIVHISKNTMTICSDAAEFEDDIDVERANEAMQRAKKRLEEADKYNKDRAESALFRATQRLRLKKSSR
ncbi:ATP synthase epsilon chain [Clostridium puniceum]|uniref:ATP synthase epsilon chain n=1 Tax=Clostridium puniceum TaxID=29367 RepID=A0A1S8SZU1_9CLOT|nr:ATP synthase F1 subunit epsilon [Clostridium puniceum]OOM71050.1 ATP synthase epsilon chain [Clostridium puniceum]